MNKVVTVPDFVGEIDMNELAKIVGVSDVFHIGTDVLSDEQSARCVSKGIEYILDTIIEQVVPKKIKKSAKVQYPNGGVKWEIEKYECHLFIYLKDGSLSYTVRLNTINHSETVRVLYFAYEHMPYYFESLMYRVLQDFTRLISECVNMVYAFEGSYKDNLPRGLHVNGAWFCDVHERRVLTPMHYCDGYIDYKNDRKLIEFDFDTWLEENKEAKA